MFVFFFFFLILHALLLSPPPPLLLSVFVCSSKSYSYPLPTVLCNKNPLWLSTSGTDEKWGIYITGCLFSDQIIISVQLSHFCFLFFSFFFCNFLLNDGDGN